jgi:subtilisin family serine protease
MKSHPYQLKAGSGGLGKRSIKPLLTALLLWAVPAGAVEKRWDQAAEAALADPGRPGAEFVPGEVLIGFHPGARARADQVRTTVAAKKLKEWPSINAEHWRLPPGLDVARAVEALSRNPNIEYAEPNYIVEAADFPSDPPNDPYRGELWGLHNVGQTGGTAGADIRALAAWGRQLGSASVVVAVVDTGIDYTHPELAANIWINPIERLDGTDTDGNGYIDDIMGWDFVNNDNDPWDDHGHGTHVAGTIGAVGNNGIGVIGVSPNVTLMPLKFLGAGGSGSTDNAVSAILYAASFKDSEGNHIVRISNNSWGGGRKSKTLENAIKNSGALFCASAGNSGSSSLHYPAGYKLANIIAVAATDHNDELARFSNYGSWVHLAAPGVNTFSTLPNESYRFASGTSMAAPHVAGALALLRAQFGDWGNAALKDRLLSTVDLKDSLSEKVTSGGRLNVAVALGAAPLPDDQIRPNRVTDLALADEPAQDSVALSWKATGDDGDDGVAYLYDLRYSSAPITEDNWSGATHVLGEPLPQAPGSTESLIVEGLRGGNTYFFALRVIDKAGNASELSNVLEAATAASEWTVEFVDETAGSYNSLAYNAEGNPTIAYNSQGNIRLASRAEFGWTFETVAAGGGGVALAYNADGAPEVAWVGDSVKGKPTTVLYFATRHGSAWNVTNFDSDVQRDTTSLAHNSAGQPSISYRVLSGGNSGLRFAWREGNTWKVQTVHSKAGARYSSLAFSPSGNPAIAYSHDADGDNWLESLMLAEGVWNGSGYSWTIATVETGVIGYGVFANVAFDSDGNPVITHGNAGDVRLVRRVDGEWFVEVVDEGRYPFMTVMTVGEASHAQIAYRANSYVLGVAAAPLDGSAPWTFSVADPEAYIFWPGSIRVGADGLPGISYTSWGLQFAKKTGF